MAIQASNLGNTSSAEEKYINAYLDIEDKHKDVKHAEAQKYILQAARTFETHTVVPYFIVPNAKVKGMRPMISLAVEELYSQEFLDRCHNTAVVARFARINAIRKAYGDKEKIRPTWRTFNKKMQEFYWNAAQARLEKPLNKGE